MSASAFLTIVILIWLCFSFVRWWGNSFGYADWNRPRNSSGTVWLDRAVAFSAFVLVTMILSAALELALTATLDVRELTRENGIERVWLVFFGSMGAAAFFDMANKIRARNRRLCIYEGAFRFLTDYICSEKETQQKLRDQWESRLAVELRQAGSDTFCRNVGIEALVLALDAIDPLYTEPDRPLRFRTTINSPGYRPPLF